jgi:hypothetical protein
MNKCLCNYTFPIWHMFPLDADINQLKDYKARSDKLFRDMTREEKEDKKEWIDEITRCARCAQYE